MNVKWGLDNEILLRYVWQLPGLTLEEMARRIYEQTGVVYTRNAIHDKARRLGCPPRELALIYGDWSSVRIAELVRLWEAGYTTAEIGRRLGVSKNAVVGKVNRLDLTPRPSPIVRGTPSSQPYQITGDGCAWPIGHPNQPDFHFCEGVTMAGKPYCSEHAALAYIRPTEKREAA